MPSYTDRRSSLGLQSPQSKYSNIRFSKCNEAPFGDANMDAAMLTTSPLPSPSSNSVDALRSPTLARPCLPSSVQCGDTPHRLNSTAEAPEVFIVDPVNYSDHIGSVTSPHPSIGSDGLWHQPQLYISDDPIIDRLLHHYSLYVANLLQPLSHPRNPYQSIYMPIALESLQQPSPGRPIPALNLKRCLFHSIIATSAFHLHTCNSFASSFCKMGIVHRQIALRCMQLAIERDTSHCYYKEFMIALLSLITIGV
jgi:hypothetical protein